MAASPIGTEPWNVGARDGTRDAAANFLRVGGYNNSLSTAGLDPHQNTVPPGHYQEDGIIAWRAGWEHAYLVEWKLQHQRGFQCYTKLSMERGLDVPSNFRRIPLTSHQSSQLWTAGLAEGILTARQACQGVNIASPAETSVSQRAPVIPTFPPATHLATWIDGFDAAFEDTKTEDIKGKRVKHVKNERSQWRKYWRPIVLFIGHLVFGNFLANYLAAVGGSVTEYYWKKEKGFLPK